ncbi:TIM23 [Auxenochlorella protothecoides x Auxenochlorella symbiontica]
MGFLDRLRGRNQEEADHVSSLDAATAAAGNDPSLFNVEASSNTLPSSSAGSNAFDIQAQDTSRLYNPYEGLAAVSRREGVPQFRLPQQPEFLFIEDATVHTRSWSENLSYYTGAGYLAGAMAGGGRGAFQALSTPLAVDGAGATQRLRLNQLLNTSGKLGRANGNSLGALGLMFAATESFGNYMSDGVVPSEVVTLAAGASAGALYRSVRGPRQAAAAAAVGALGAGALILARKTISRGL